MEACACSATPALILFARLASEYSGLSEMPMLTGKKPGSEVTLNIILKFIFIAMLICLATQAVCAEDRKEITVSAAISLKNAFEELGRAYTAKSGVVVLLNFGASGDLARQIEGGAAVDVFASAAQKDMDDLNARGYILGSTRINFAKNALVLVALQSAGVRISSFKDLLSDRVKLIAAGNPRTVPAGRYAAEVFEYYGIAPKISGKLIYGENVRQVLDYVARGEVDAGVVYSTDAAIRTEHIYAAAVAPESSHKPIICPIAVVRGSRHTAAAEEFIEFVRSADGMAVLRKYGFRMP